MANEFLQRRHASYATPRHVIFDLIKTATGQEAIAREQITRGYDNEVYRVRTRQGEEYVVRIGHHGGVGFKQQVWAMDRCREAGAPIPDVYLSTTIADTDQPREAMVMQTVPGRPLSDIQATLTRAELAHVCRQVGAAMSAIHGVRAGGFYRMSADGRWDFPDWQSIARSAIQERAAETPLLLQGGLSQAEVDALLRILSKVLTLDYPRPVLCHGDLGSDHVFVDDHLRLTGVIDFGDFQGGPAVLDFAILLMNEPTFELEWLQQAYHPASLFDESFPTQLLVQQAGLQMGYLAHYVREGNADERAALLEGIRRTIRSWVRLHSLDA
jgi:Ser/Thr protein kinase RdoA (MazF antagonist)